MHGRAGMVRLLVERGADITDCAFDDEGPSPLDCAVWGFRNNRAADGDYVGTVQVLVDLGAPTRLSPPTGDDEIDALLTRSATGGRGRPAGWQRELDAVGTQRSAVTVQDLVLAVEDEAGATGGDAGPAHLLGDPGALLP